MEERIKSLETITKRLMRRAGKRTSAIITPYPISSAMFGEKLEGPVLRYMFPCNGTITKGIIRLGNKPKKNIVVEVKLFNDISSVSKGFSIERKLLNVEPNIPVIMGDCLEISLVAGEEIVTEIWLSFLWRPTVKDTEVKTFLIEDMENDLQKKEELTP